MTVCYRKVWLTWDKTVGGLVFDIFAPIAWVPR